MTVSSSLTHVQRNINGNRRKVGWLNRIWEKPTIKQIENFQTSCSQERDSDQSGENGFRCISTSQFSILINWSPKSSFSASRGPRQSDPLSPSLFTIVEDSFSQVMNKGVQTRLSKGSPSVQKGCKSPAYSIQMTLLFYSMSLEQTLEIKSVDWLLWLGTWILS